MTNIASDLSAEGVLSLTLDNPEKLNALSTACLEQLDQLLTTAKSDSQTKAILLTGKGKAFSAGADIRRLAECDALAGYEFALMGQSVFHKLEDMGKPSLAAVNGYCFGGGCELAMSASLRMASTNAVFGQPEIKLGVIPGYGGTQRLARLIGKGRAIDLCLTGRSIDAQTALDWGLVTEIAPCEDLQFRAMSLLKELAMMPAVAMEAILSTIHHGYDLSLPDALHLEASHFARTCATQDKQEGVSAFLEKRKAVFTGK